MNEAIPKTADLTARTVPKTQFLIFALAGCEMGVDIGRVREIIRYPEMTIMPKAPRFMEGIMNLRGRIFPVLDLKKRFEMPPVDRTAESRIVVLEVRGQVFGLLVDKVKEVLAVPAPEIFLEPRPFLTVGSAYILGFLQPADRLVALLNMDEVFSFADIKAYSDQESANRLEG